jgi:hypothetical protein
VNVEQSRPIVEVPWANIHAVHCVPKKHAMQKPVHHRGGAAERVGHQSLSFCTKKPNSNVCYLVAIRKKKT